MKVPPTYCAQNILAEEKELLFLRVKPVEEAESLPRVSKHCLQRHCMRKGGRGRGRLQRPHLTHAKVSAGGLRCPILLSLASPLGSEKSHSKLGQSPLTHSLSLTKSL